MALDMDMVVTIQDIIMVTGMASTMDTMQVAEATITTTVSTTTHITTAIAGLQPV
jgi:hypothetical protein